MIRRPPRSTRTDTLFPYTTLFRSFTDRPRLRALVANENADRSALYRQIAVSNGEPGWTTRSASPGSARPGSTKSTARSEEHTSELQSLMRISYAVFCLKKKNKTTQTNKHKSTTHIYYNQHNT